MTKKVNVLAIDGPSGSGKSTLAKILSEKLGLVYQDTGSMFRALGLYLHNLKIEPNDDLAIKKALDSLEFEYDVNQQILVRLNGADFTEVIREHHVSKLASLYSQNLVVRDYLANLQRSIALGRPSVLDGRDIGTVIFPNAIAKIYLVADPEIRAKRRFDQLQSLGQDQTTLKDILQDIVARDNQDMNRELAPLTKAQDAIEIDATELSIDQAAKKIEDIYRKQLQNLNK